MGIISMTAGLPGPRSRVVSPPHAVAGHRIAAHLGRQVLHLGAYNRSCFRGHTKGRFVFPCHIAAADINFHTQSAK